MTSKTKRPLISQDSIDRMNELKTTDQLRKEYNDFIRGIDKATLQAKMKNIESLYGEDNELMEEVLRKREALKKSKINEIIKITEKYPPKKLERMSFDEVDNIYSEIVTPAKKNKSKGLLRKIFDFVFFNN